MSEHIAGIVLCCVVVIVAALAWCWIGAHICMALDMKSMFTVTATVMCSFLLFVAGVLFWIASLPAARNPDRCQVGAKPKAKPSERCLIRHDQTGITATAVQANVEKTPAACMPAMTMETTGDNKRPYDDDLQDSYTPRRSTFTDEETRAYTVREN